LPVAARHRLRPLEALWAVPFGRDEGAPPLPPAAGPPRAALDAVLRRALERPPCLVSFSGGLDSSAVLALAADVARREGLAPPIPATHRFPGLAEADERSWQEMVVAHLGLSDWLRLEWTDELDMLGPVATDVLRRHGVLVPFNAHFHAPLLERAAGGSLLTGVGGDELFEDVSRARLASVSFGGRRPRARELPLLAFAVAPAAVRVPVIARRRGFEGFGWIRPHARRLLAREYARWEARDPLRWDRALREWWWPGRHLQCNVAGKAALAAGHDVEIAHPLSDPAVLAAFAADGGAAGPGDRRRGLARLLGPLLPPALLERRTKASFDGAFWAGTAREFARGWDGGGVDPALVDAERLRAEWLKPRPDAHSFALLQAAWLSAQARDQRRDAVQ
jgi:asparagine synthase (glutamine-hydrolysing)